MKFKEDGTQWYNYFHIRSKPEGYYFAWNGSTREAFEGHYFRCVTNMKAWILNRNWKEIVDQEFEKEVLDG